LVVTYEFKYPKAINCLLKDRESLMTFYDFPAVHSQHLRTTNPIESTFATIRHRTTRMKGCVTRDSMLHMMFKHSANALRKLEKTTRLQIPGKGH